MSYYDPNENDATVVAKALFSISGLSNTEHTVAITNVPDSSKGGAYGQITVDHIIIDGTPVAVPTFPEDGQITNIPTPSDVEQAYWIPVILGEHTPALTGKSIL